MATRLNDTIKYQLLDQSRLAPFVKLISSHGISILDMSDQAFLQDIFQDAVKGQNPVAIIAIDSQGNIMGWNIAIINSRNYLIKFLAKHPTYLFRKIFNGFPRSGRGKYGVSRNSNEPLISREIDWPQTMPVHWGQSNPLVARHIDITVLENIRHSGIGKNLHLELEMTLRRKSVQRIDACIHSGNLISQIFHVKAGWALVKKDINWIYITKELK